MSHDQPANAGKQQPVDRGRRARFIGRIVTFCLGTGLLLTVGAGLGILDNNIALTTEYVVGVLGLAGVATAVYVTGSSVDYNGGIGNIFTRKHPEPPTVVVNNDVPAEKPPKNEDGSFG